MSDQYKLMPADEIRKIWKDVFGFYDQKSLAETMGVTPSKLSEMLNNKRNPSLRNIRFLVSCGADAEIMIRENTREKEVKGILE